MSAGSGGGRSRRTWPQRLLICFNVCCIVVALAAAGLVAYGKQTVAQISRVTIGGPGVQPVTELAAGDPQNFLIVGVDDDSRLPADDPVRDGRDGQVEGLRSDTIMVVRIDPEQGEARILSFPRDLLVDIPNHGRSRINTAVQYGSDSGPSLLIATLKANFDIDVNHYVQVDLAGFKDMISQIGGVQVYLSNPVRDGRSGLYQPEAGCVTLDPDQSLAYVRSRHLQYQKNGRWRSDPTSDLGRISRQQDFTRRVVKRAIARGARNPATLRRMVESGVRTIKLDQYTTPKDLIVLGRTFRNYDPDELITYSLPVTDVVRGGAQVLELEEGRAEPILSLFRGTGSAGGAAAEISPASVTVRVRNGTGTPNQGTDTTNQFAAAGFQVRSPGNDMPVHYARTVVRYRPGQEAEAIAVARHLAANPSLVPDPEAPEITVVTGADLIGVMKTPRPAREIVTTTSTTTTAPAGTTPKVTAPVSTPVDPGVAVTQPQGYLPGTAPDGSACG